MIQRNRKQKTAREEPSCAYCTPLGHTHRVRTVGRGVNALFGDDSRNVAKDALQGHLPLLVRHLPKKNRERRRLVTRPAEASRALKIEINLQHAVITDVTSSMGVSTTGTAKKYTEYPP